MKTFKNSSSIILFLVCVLVNFSFGSLFPLKLNLPNISSFIPSILSPFSSISFTNKTVSENREPIKLDNILRSLASVTSASATLDELKSAINSSQFFEAKLLKKRSPWPQKRPVLFEDIEEWLDPVTSASATKDEFRKILSEVFPSVPLVVQKKRSTDLEEVNAERTVRDASDSRYGEGMASMPNFAPSNGNLGLFGTILEYFGLTTGNPYQYGDTNGLIQNMTSSLFSDFTRGLHEVVRSLSAMLKNLMQNVYYFLTYPLRALGLISPNYPSAYLTGPGSGNYIPGSNTPSYPSVAGGGYDYNQYTRKRRAIDESKKDINQIEEENYISDLQQLLTKGFTKLMEKAKKKNPLIDADHTNLAVFFEQLPIIKNLLNELYKSLLILINIEHQEK